MSSYCDSWSQNCSYRCCDRYGSCPYYSSDCYYNYSTSSYTLDLSSGAKAGIAVGVVLFFVGLGLLIYFCRRRNQIPIQSSSFPMEQTTVIIPGQQPGYAQPGYGAQPFGQPYGTPAPYGAQPFGQPQMYNPSGQVIINQM